MSAAHAAAEARRRREEEEETMTPYSPRDLAEHWEFKILRSATRAFKDPQVLQRTLAEEAQAGWLLVEKFDNGRIRLKRPAGAAQNDPMLPFDAYRTNVGMSETKLGLCIGGSVLAAVTGMLALIALLTKG